MSTTKPRRQIVPRVLAGFTAATLALAACGGGDAGGSATTATKPAPIGAEIDVTAGAVAVASAGPPDVVPADEVRDQIVASVREYITIASVEPLLTGEPAGDLGVLLTPTANARAGGIDRPVLTDEGISPATETVVARAAPVSLTVLADQLGNVVLITAALDLGITTSTAQGEVSILRRGELTFVPDAGMWKIASFDVTVARDGPGIEEPQAIENQEGSP